MRNNFSLLTHKGRWLLATLTLLFTLGIGQMWAANPYYASQDWGSDDFSSVVANHTNVVITSSATAFQDNFSGKYYIQCGSSSGITSGYMRFAATEQIDSVAVFFIGNSTTAAGISWCGWGKNVTPSVEVGSNYGSTATFAYSAKNYANARWMTIDISDKNLYTLQIFRQGKNLTNNGNKISNFGANQTINILGIKVWLHPAAVTKYTITYAKGEYGTGDAIANGEKTKDVAFTLSSSTYSRENYTQQGWSTTDGGAKAYDLGGSYTANADITLYPFWVSSAAATHDISYTNTKGATNSNPAKYTEGVGVASFEPLADVTDFHFTGWSPASIAADATGNQTIEAQWVDAYNVSFSAGAGSGTAPDGFQKWEDAKFNLPGQGEMVAPSGKAFDGWKANGSGDKLAAGSEYTMGDAEVAFVAQWKAVPVVLFHYQQSNLSGNLAAGTYDAIGGTLTTSAAMSKESAAYNAAVPNDLKGGANVSKLGSNAAYIQLTLTTGKFKEGDTVYICGYNPYKISSTAELTADIAASFTTGTAKGDYNIGYAIIPEGIEQSSIYLSRAEGNGTGFAAVKVIRPAERPSSTTITLSDVKVNNRSISSDSLTTLLSAKSLLLKDEYAVAPVIKFNEHKVITYSDELLPATKVTDKVHTVTATLVDGNWQAQATINAIPYTVTAQKQSSAKVTYYDDATKLGEETVGIGGHPAEYAAKQSKDFATFVAWYSNSDLAEEHKIANIAELVVNEATNVYGKWTPAYAQSINIEQWVLDNGAGKGATTKTSALLAEMGTKNYLSNIAWENKNNELDTLDDSKTDGKRNYAYLGLKVKKDASNVRFLLQGGKSLKVKFGNVAATPNIKIGDAAATAMTITDGVYSLDAASGDREITISTTSAGAVVFKQIMIDEEIQNVILPAIVTLDANGGTYTDESVKYTGTPLVIGDATPADAEHIFEGWHVGTVEGAKIDASAYVPTANVTLVAKYVVKPSPFSLTALTYTIGAGEAQNVGYVEGTYTYTVELPYAGSYENITVAATLKEAGSSIVDDATKVLTVTSLPGAATFTVSDGAEGTQLYTINFKKAAKDGVEIIGVVTTGGTNKTVSGLYKGDASVSLANDKKIGNNNYIYVTLASGYTFEETDVLVVDVKAKSDLPNDPALEITTGDGNIDGSVWKSIANADYELHLVTIPLKGIAANQTSIGLKRSDHQNTWVNGLKVYRPMNPVLTAIQFNETDVEVTSTAVAATLPNGTNLSTMTVTPTIAWNGAGTAAPTAAWAWGPNTYRVTDKDGDYTDYTITLTEAIPAVDPTLTYNEGAYMVGASALDLSTLIDEANSDGEITYTVKTDGGTSATITDGKFTATAAGTATITATQAATVAYNAKTVDFNVVVTVATEIDGIKLVEAGALTGKFVTASTLSDGAYTIEGINYAKYIKFNSTFSGSYNSGARNNYLIYDLKKENTTFHVYAHNNTSTAYKIVAYAYDDVNAKVAEVEVAANENAIKSFSLNDITKNTRVFIGVENNNIYFCQVVAVESGADLMKAGEPGYSIDFGAKSRFTAASGTAIDLDGMEFVTSSGYTPNSSTEVGLGSIGTNYVKFKLDAPTTVEVRTNSTNQYYIGSTYDAEAATSKTYGYKPTSNGETHSFDLTAGTWYLNPNTSNIKLTKLAFSLPKCEKPTITAQPATKQTFGPGNLTATVVADDPSDGGTLKYQWYDAATDEEVENATEATLTTTTPGTYYVIVTNTLADHSDNSVKSANATLGYRVMNDATLSALSYGTPATAIALEADKYDYRVDLAMGTIDVPALAATATMAPYPTVVITNATEFVNYEATSTVVVTAEDGLTTKTYTVKFVVDHIYTALVDVTGSTTWNWTGSEEATINDVANKGLILANYIDGLNFEKIEGKEGERARRDQNDGVYQGTHLHFNTTVPGKVKFYFRAPSSGEECVITVINNGKEIRVDSTGNSIKWSREVVVYGDVVIEMENKKEGKTDTRVQQIVFTEATPNYTRDVTNNIGTLCVDHNVLAGGALGATFYQIASRNELYNDKIDFEEVLPNEELKAGEPYIFKSTTGKIELFYGATPVTEPEAVRGMHGWFDVAAPIDETKYDMLDITEENKSDILYIAQNKLWNCEDLVTGDLKVVNNRAYIVMSEVPTYAEYQEAQQNSNSAPRRRVTLGKDAEQIATGFENINAGDKPMKLMINGQIFILRGEKMYDATGRLVK